MLQIIIFNNWSTEYSKKTKGFFKKMISHLRNTPYYMPAKSLAKVK